MNVVQVIDFDWLQWQQKALRKESWMCIAVSVFLLQYKVVPESVETFQIILNCLGNTEMRNQPKIVSFPIIMHFIVQIIVGIAF